MSGYILDDLALVGGLDRTAGERARRELSWLIHIAVTGGPGLDVPALCLAEAATVRRSIATHIADLVAQSPPGAVAIRELVRGDDLDTTLTADPPLDWAGTHAVSHARTTGQLIVTLHPERYRSLGVKARALVITGG